MAGIKTAGHARAGLWQVQAQDFQARISDFSYWPVQIRHHGKFTGVSAGCTPIEFPSRRHSFPL
jgi:hypothetical protein